MLILVGLGNPEKRFELTRHNAGACLVNLIAQQRQLSWRTQPKLKAELAMIQSDQADKRAILVKPTVYMNQSGEAVRQVVSFYQDIAGEYPKLLIIHDDLDLELGQYKIQYDRGPKVHNGLRSIYQHLHTSLFWHVRLGVDGREGQRLSAGADYVLSNFSASEKIRFDQTLRQCAAELSERFSF